MSYGNSRNSLLDTLRLPLHQALGSDAGGLFAQISYVPLEQTSKSIVQEVQDLWVTEEYFIIFDLRGKAILFFDRQGKFQHKIDKVPHCASCSRGSFLFINVFVNKVERLVYASYGNTMDNAAMGIFRFDGSFVEEKKDWITVDGMGFLDGGIFLNHSPYVDAHKTTVQLFKAAKYTDILEKQVLDKLNYFSVNTMFSKSRYKEDLLYVQPYKNVLYFLGEDGVSRETVLIFPYQNSLPKDFLSESKVRFNEVIAQKYPDAIFGLANPFIHKGRLFTTLMTVNASENVDGLMYDTQEGRLYDLKKVRADKSTQFLPISSSSSSSYFMDNDRDYLYSFITRQDVLKLFSENPSFHKEEDNFSFTKELLNPKNKLTNPIMVISNIK